MRTKTRKRRRVKRPLERRRTLRSALENDSIKRLSGDEYRDVVQRVYGGPKGAILATCSALSLHTALGDRLLRERRFDLRGMRSILDVGSGAGQIARHLLKYADPEARITCVDLSQPMLRRSRLRLKSDVPSFVAADITQLPFADGSFDGITCGYVLEHVPDPRTGLSEMARVLKPGGRMLLLTTEDNYAGAWTSRLWCCQTYNRQELRRICEDVGFSWNKEIWFTRMHKMLRAGGIGAELVKIGS